MDKEFIVISILSFTVIVLGFTKEQLNNNLAQYDGSIPELEQKTHILHVENLSLKDELLEKESYTQISKEAKLSGFIPAPFVTP